MAQFTCEICHEGFDQRSRYERHMASSHPERAPSAADVEKALTGMTFPSGKRDLVSHASPRVRGNAALRHLLESLPERQYRDAADVAIALGEMKSGGRIRTAKEVEASEAPSEKGGRTAASGAVSAAAVATMLAGIDFPVSKAELLQHARTNASNIAAPQAVLSVLDRLPEERYADMADVERAFGTIVA